MTAEDFNRVYFKGRLSTEVMDVLRVLDHGSSQARENVWALLKNYVDAVYSPLDLSLQIADQLTNAQALFQDDGKPKAAPYTSKGRHRRLDHFLLRLLSERFEGRILEVGCGYPPYTATELAHTFPRASVVGMEPLFPAYSIEDSSGYALLNEQGAVMALHSNTFEGMNALHGEYEKTRLRYESLFKQLMGGQEFSSEIKFDRNPLSTFLKTNLSFKRGRIGDPLEGAFDCIRVMNVLIFFDVQFRTKFFEWASMHLNDGGVIVIGANTFDSTYLRASLWKKRLGKIEFDRFLFSLESIRAMGGIASFATPDVSDRELACQKQVVRVIRQNKLLLDKFDQLMDEELGKRSLAARDPNGYLNHPTLETNLAALIEISEVLTPLLSREILDTLAHSVIEAAILEHGLISCTGVAIESVVRGELGQ